MQEIQIKTLNIEGKTYFLLDSIKHDQNIYHFFVELINPNNIQVLKDKKENEDVYYVSLDTESEFDYALSLFYDKYYKRKEVNPVVN